MSNVKALIEQEVMRFCKVSTQEEPMREALIRVAEAAAREALKERSRRVAKYGEWSDIEVVQAVLNGDSNGKA